jgi:predicted hotdog family 3-hydroxylacyl-ACP dehydratase
VSTVLSRQEIERLLPQKAAMCLIDSASADEDDALICLADAARADHPLREPEGVAAEHAIEYGAQAAALHRCLTAREQSAAGGLLLQIRKAEFHVRWLDRLPQPLAVSARCVLASSEAASYRFEVRSGETLAARGELTLKLTSPGC